MSNKRKLDKLLRVEGFSDDSKKTAILDYALAMAEVENVVAVVSDMVKDESHIVAGAFASVIGLADYTQENSIWENRILSMMSEEEQEAKFIAELRFYHYLRHLPKSKRANHYLITKLRFQLSDRKAINVLHRMYYIFDKENDTVLYAICLYGSLPFDFNGKSYVIDSVSGIKEELTASTNTTILGKRELQVLSLIDKGMKSTEIAELLNISINTVNRHRQEILARLQVKNSIEACRLARTMRLI